MPPSIPTRVPPNLTAGTSWRWDASFSDFPASAGWLLSYLLRGTGSLDLSTAQVIPVGDGFEVRVPAATTAALQPGQYRWVARVALGDEVHEADCGVVTVAPDFASVTDGRTHAERTLEIINARIEGRLTKDMESFQISGRAVNHIPMEELVRLKSIYATKVRRQRNPGQLARRVNVIFTNG